MKEKELRARLNAMFGDVPPEVHSAFMQAVTSGKEQEMKKHPKSFKLVIVLVVLTVLLCTTAYATSSGHLAWFYNQVDQMTKELHPEKYNAILDNVRTMPQQEVQESDEINLEVTEVSYVENLKLLNFIASFSAKAPDSAEVYAYNNLDVDGAYGEPQGPDDEDAHSMHYLWRRTGYGAIPEMMSDPTKAVYFVEIRNIMLGNMPLMTASFVTEDEQGTSIYQCKIDLSRIDWTAEDIADAIADNRMTLRMSYAVYGYDRETDMVYRTPDFEKEDKWLTFVVDLSAAQSDSSAAPKE